MGGGGDGHHLCAMVTICAAGGQWRGGGLAAGQASGWAGRQAGRQTGGGKLRLTMAQAQLFKVQAPPPHTPVLHSSCFCRPMPLDA